MVYDMQVWAGGVGGYNNSCRSSSSRKGVKEEKGEDARNRVYGAEKNTGTHSCSGKQLHSFALLRMTILV